MSNIHFSASLMSNDELEEKLNVLTSKFYMAHMNGMSFEIRDQIQQMIESIQNELAERTLVEITTQWNNQFPDVIESDPIDGEHKLEEKRPEVTKKNEKEMPKHMQFKKVYRGDN